MAPSTPARSNINSRPSFQNSTPNQSKSGHAQGSNPSVNVKTPASNAANWRTRVRSTTSTSYATPAAQSRRRTVSDQQIQGTQDLSETPGLSYGDTPSTVGSSVGSSLPATPASPTYRQPRNSKNVPYVPSNLHSRHHSSPLHRSLGLPADDSFDESYEQDISFDEGVGIHSMMPQSAAARKLRLGILPEENTEPFTISASKLDQDWSAPSQTGASPLRWRQVSEASSYASQTDGEDATSVKTVTPATTPPRSKTRALSSGAVPHFLTPPPVNTRGRVIVPIAPATVAPSLRGTSRRSLSPFYENDEPLLPIDKSISKPRFAGLSPAQRGTLVSVVNRAIAIRKPQSPTPKSATPTAILGSQTIEAPSQAEPQQSSAICGCCEDEIKKDGVKIGPCACVVCKQCFTSGMNVVCDVAGGIMRCPSCTTTVNDFSTFSPPKQETSSKVQPKVQTRVLPSINDQSNMPVILRFDNASWDVTPEMIIDFLPENALADPSQNPHPIHLLINPFDGKTKDFFFVEVVSKSAAAAVIKSCQSTILGEGRRARPVTITLSNLTELRREIQPTSARALNSVLELCSTAFSTKKSYIKRKSFPFLYMMTILTRASLKGLEMDLLVVFQGAALIISNLLESGAASTSELALARALYSVLLLSPLLTPVVCGPFIGVMPGPAHPLSRPVVQPQMPQLMFNSMGIPGYNGMGMIAPANVGQSYLQQQHQHQQQMFAMNGQLRI
ncbi:Nucleotide-binding, alpha-beta plait [Phaffia rhodozyma]|uniref:Nucleotide-binding, alpha-beta plait n=1 Tax=Phaffia rhodozyma TaxID=264483 RepID=A0A0F7SGV2_PHARH|nr:Nucleotide-binding, alpha-beta plait [Phaffia rhodozyma]